MIQIFGTNKSFDTKAAQRFFKERRIDFQFVDLKEKEMSPGEQRNRSLQFHRLEDVEVRRTRIEQKQH